MVLPHAAHKPDRDQPGTPARPDHRQQPITELAEEPEMRVRAHSVTTLCLTGDHYYRLCLANDHDHDHYVPVCRTAG